MAEFIQTATIARRLFLPDAIPWSSLLAESNLEKLRSRYKLSEVIPQFQDPATGIQPQVFSLRGEFVASGKTLLIQQLLIQPTVVQFQIDGNSDEADVFMLDLGILFVEIDPNKRYSDTSELTRTYQTIAVVKLSVPVSALFSDRFSHFLTDVVTPRLTPQNTEIDVRLLAVRWTVTYRLPTPDFTYLPKPLVIEPRQGSRPSDMLYFTQSPTDFKTHKELLEALEKALS
jgi:hypothetical protein